MFIINAVSNIFALLIGEGIIITLISRVHRSHYIAGGIRGITHFTKIKNYQAEGSPSNCRIHPVQELKVCQCRPCTQLFMEMLFSAKFRRASRALARVRIPYLLITVRAIKHCSNQKSPQNRGTISLGVPHQ